VQGRWKMGDRNPAEPELIEEMGVSRGTMREAIKSLARTGEFGLRRGDGTYVRALSEISGTAQRLYREHADKDMPQVCFALDTKSARQAADAQVVQRLRTLPGQRAKAWRTQDFQAWSQADWQFHLEVAHVSGVILMHESFGDIFHDTKMLQRLADGFDGCLHAGHEALADAIEVGDPEAVAKNVIENLDYCMGRMMDGERKGDTRTPVPHEF